MQVGTLPGGREHRWQVGVAAWRAGYVQLEGVRAEPETTLMAASGASSIAVSRCSTIR